MITHFTGYFDRRCKGKSFKPFVFLLFEIILLSLVIYIMSLFKIKILTILVILAVLYFIIMSSIPRYLKVKRRVKKDEHIYNNMENI